MHANATVEVLVMKSINSWWIQSLFWFCFGFFEPLFRHRICKMKGRFPWIRTEACF